MIERRVDFDNDWNFGHGLSDYAQAEEAVNQNVKGRVLSWVNDCFFALNDGIDWRNRLDVGQQDALRDEVNTLILQSFGVVSINNLTMFFDPRTRNLLVQYDIQTIFSPSFQSQIEQSAGVNVSA